MASDEGVGGPAPRRKGVDQGFRWVSSSPSPAEVARLEDTFPSIVKIQEALLEEEESQWKNRAVLARSFMRWVPAEAFIREFRRAGIPGSIVPISLAFRCYIFRFEDPGACELILNRPWVINGQIIGMEAWKPEFFPSADSISSALVWMRLPNLPMEFWREEILRSITEPAGCFCGADSATQMKNRGGYARVAVRVELLRPLRPGTRIQGSQGPFWQQYSYEAMEGICSNCGSLHLDDSCSLPDAPETEEVGSGPLFGSWMAAVRQRRPAVKPSQSGASSGSKPPQSGVSSVPVSPLSPASIGGSVLLNQAEGWQIPSKTARRHPPAPLKDAVVNQKQMRKLNGDGLVAVPVSLQRAGFEPDIIGKLNFNQQAGNDKLNINSNPFAALGLDSNVGGQVVIREVCPGPLKRARPADSLPPRSVTRAGKKKGKGKSSALLCKVDLIPSSSTQPEPSCSPVADQGSEGSSETIKGQGSDSLSTVHSHSAIDIGTVPVTMESNNSHKSKDDNQSAGCLSDCVMDEDRGGIPSTPC